MFYILLEGKDKLSIFLKEEIYQEGEKQITTIATVKLHFGLMAHNGDVEEVFV